MMKNALTDLLAGDENEKVLSGLRGASPAMLCAALAEKKRCCCIVADEEQVSILENDLRMFSGIRKLIYPGYEIPPYTPLSPDQHTTAQRLSTLYHLQDEEPFILVLSQEALMRRVMPKELLMECVELVMAGEECDQAELLHNLVAGGYEQVALVRNVGDFSVRGGIIDIYPPPFMDVEGKIHDTPLRLDFFGDTVESLRGFNPVSQRRSREFDEALLLPVSDILFESGTTSSSRLRTDFLEASEKYLWDGGQAAAVIEQLERRHRFAGVEFFLPLFYRSMSSVSSSVFDYLPENTHLLFIDPDNGRQNINLVQERIDANYEDAVNNRAPALPPEQLFLNPEQVADNTDRYDRILLSDFALESDDHTPLISDHLLLRQEISLQRKKRGLLAPLTDQILDWQKHGDRVVLCCRPGRHIKTLHEMLEKHHHRLELLDSPLDAAKRDSLSSDRLYLCDSSLSKGFSLGAEKLHLLSESELFGEMRLGKRKKDGYQKGEPINFTELGEGDVVVHRDHGLGTYLGLTTMEFQGVRNDFMLIEYRGGDKLYLPVDRLNLVSRYEGLSDRQPRIDKLGAQSWKTTKSKVKEEVWKVAQELLDIYAKREIRTGRQFSAPGGMFHELEESFPYDETPGQGKAINDTLDDLTSSKPMDRLVCGDVGYGKTEVAVRAAFKVVEDGFQAAVLVPTTVLAEQHAKTFVDRLEGFPVTVACINRFRTPAEQKAIVADLAAGRIDIIIGTHRLLSKDIVYRNLGLLVVDEEHRFGVSHKEKIKRIKSEVDILTLTATPIPRTLQMSLLGIRDLSVISSPPEHRRPVKTFVARYDDLVIKEAVMREMRRKGQVFIVHNRVKSIHRVGARIKELVPDARIAVAHGQMGGKELEEIMVSFVNRKIDVLVSTTIIESGLDIPSANTIIINRADMLGLAEIYQLRGRVGRSSTQSFAYLLVPSLDLLSKEAKDRLRALMDCSELGGGFKLAMSDLQIRGGGNLLGVSQSGHIAAIGYDLYLDLLQKTVADLKVQAAGGDKGLAEIDPEVNLGLSAYIPETYISDVSQRYIAYRRISGLGSGASDQEDDLREELRDRYGRIPVETDNLFFVVNLKKELSGLRIKKLERGKDNLVFSFMADTPLSPEKLLAFMEKPTVTGAGAPPRLTPDGRLIIATGPVEEGDLLPVTGRVITSLSVLTDGQKTEN
ncbi:MAG: transcription-repair coupling factor [Thermodesulfobacteriota bacterium]